MKKLIIISPKYGKKTVLYDSEDHKLISKYHWYVQKGKFTFYVLAPVVLKNGLRTTVLMHRLIMGVSGGNLEIKIDHRDRNALNNQKNNLRKCTDAQNCMHSKKRDNNTSGYKGVIYHKKNKNWRARIGMGRKKINVGSFSTRIAAARAYNEAALRLHGEFALLNKIPNRT